MNLKFASLEWKPSEHFKMQAGAVLQNHYMTQERSVRPKTSVNSKFLVKFMTF